MIKMNKEWFVFKGTHHLGPFSIEEMEEFYRVQEIDAKTLAWKEGTEKWEPLSKIGIFQFLFATPENEDDAPPPLPNIPRLPKAPMESESGQADQPIARAIGLFDDDLPPPIPLDAFLDPNGTRRLRIKSEAKKSRLSKISLFVGIALFGAVIGWYSLTQRDAGIQLKIKGLMPVYLEKLEMTATKKTPRFEVAVALSLDGQILWGSSNYPGEIFANIQLKSIPKRVLGTEDIAVSVKGEFNNHIGKFTRMVLTKGAKFLPGEYTVHVEARETHFLNRNFRTLAGIDFFKSLNKTYAYDGTALIYAGTPREFEKRLAEYMASIVGEMLKPYQDKLERIQTLESILNATSQNYIMIIEKVNFGKSVSLFEAKFIKEISPLLQTLVLKASELASDPKIMEEEKSASVIAPYREQVQIGKQIGEMASDMITTTAKFRRFTDKDKTELKAQFEKRAKVIKQQIDLNMKKLEEQIQKISQ